MRDFEFGLYPIANDTIVTNGIPIGVWATGQQTVQVPSFDEMGGARVLEKVKLSVDMTVAPTQIIVVKPVEESLLLLNGELGEICIECTSEVSGRAVSGPLVAEVDFDLVFPSETIRTLETELPGVHGTGMDMTTLPSELAFFIDGGGDVDINIMAKILSPIFQDLALLTVEGNGFAPYVAYGQVELTYDYREGGVIPTPAALAGGFALLGVLSVRRRRARGG